MQDEKQHTSLTRKQLVDEIFRLNDEIDKRIAEAEVGGMEWQRGYETWKESSQDQINAARNKIAMMRTQDVSAREIAIAAIIAVVEVDKASRKEAGTGSGIFDPLNDKWVPAEGSNSLRATISELVAVLEKIEALNQGSASSLARSALATMKLIS